MSANLDRLRGTTRYDHRRQRGTCTLHDDCRECPALALACHLVTLTATPHEGLRFADFAALRVSGQDRYSRKSHAQLTALIGEADATSTIIDLEGDLDAARVAMRWQCRGLGRTHAVRKALVDREVSRNAYVARAASTP